MLYTAAEGLALLLTRHLPAREDVSEAHAQLIESRGAPLRSRQALSGARDAHAPSHGSAVLALGE